MQWFDWGITAAAVLMFLLAVRVMFMSGKQGNEGKTKLGCGFGFVAACLWAYVLRDHVGSFWPAARIGLGLFLVLPAAKALANPRGKNLALAAISLAVGVIVAGPVVQRLWSEYRPDERPRVRAPARAAGRGARRRPSRAWRRAVRPSNRSEPSSGPSSAPWGWTRRSCSPTSRR